MLLLAAFLICQATWFVPPASAASSLDVPADCPAGSNPATIGTVTSSPVLPQPDDCSLPDPFLPPEIPAHALPDLRTQPPFDLAIVLLPGGSRELRLSNMVWNSGKGVLELEGDLDPATQTVSVAQNIYAESGQQYKRLIGQFIWHNEHHHWHLDEFSIYELWVLSTSGNMEKLVRNSDKVSYCIIDTDITDRLVDGFSTQRRFRGCGRTIQGLSIGWGDTYKSHLDGQSIPLNGIGDGLYALKSTVNPEAILLESNYDNNAGFTFFQIRGDVVELFDLTDHISTYCRESTQQNRRDEFCIQ